MFGRNPINFIKSKKNSNNKTKEEKLKQKYINV